MKVTDLLAAVTAGISGSGDVVAERVTAALVEKEVSSRTDAFLAVLAKLNDSRNAAKKIRPDVETWPVGEDGAPAAVSLKSFSKAKLDELKKNGEEQKKLEEALDKALGGDFVKVKELSASPKGGVPAKPAASEE